MNKAVKKIWNIATTILVVLVVALAVLLVGARIIGLQVYAVLSGSMEPTYHTGSLIYVTNASLNSQELLWLSPYHTNQKGFFFFR